MTIKKLASVVVLSVLAFTLQTGSTVHAEEAAQGQEANQRESTGVTKGPRCTFTRSEKFGMLLWIIPPAGAIYTPFACKRDVFNKKSDVDAG